MYSDEVILCQKEIRRLRFVVRSYEAQMRELWHYLEQMEKDPALGEEAKRAVREISEFWRRVSEA